MDVVVCLRSASVRLIDVLRDAGFRIDQVSRLNDVADLIQIGDSVVVVFDTSDEDWLRHVTDLTEVRPGSLPVLLAELDNADEYVVAVSAGVAGFCCPTASPDAVLRTVNSVARTGAAIPRDIVPALVDHLRHGPGREVRTVDGPVEVTDREWEVLQLLLQRRSTREMAETLYVSVGTVRCHVSTLLKKLGATDREHAISLVYRGHHHDIV